MREVFCRYWTPARFDDVLIVETKILEVGGASVRFGYRITRQDDHVLIAEAVDQLPPGYRKIFILHDVEGYEHKEIAEMIGASRETVTRLFASFKRKRLVEVRGPILIIANKAALERLLDA